MRTFIISVHRSRRAARQRERELQDALDTLGVAGADAAVERAGLAVVASLPSWTQGVRVEPIGPTDPRAKSWPPGTPAVIRNRRQFALVATDTRGH
jgi:hypothetical protein